MSWARNGDECLALTKPFSLNLGLPRDNPSEDHGIQLPPITPINSFVSACVLFPIKIQPSSAILHCSSCQPTFIWTYCAAEEQHANTVLSNLGSCL